MATFDDLFGKKSGGKYIKWNAVGEMLIFQVNGEVDAAAPQKDFRSGEKKYMVETEEKKPDGKNKWKPMLESQFSPETQEEKDLGFFPLTQIEIPVTVVGRKLASGETDDTHEPFDGTWELTDQQKERLKEAMMEDRDIQLVPGTIIAVKWIDDGKPRKYAIKLKAGE